jgi:coenzyme F420-reducing hydrogenase gamma subunit
MKITVTLTFDTLDEYVNYTQSLQTVYGEEDPATLLAGLRSRPGDTGYETPGCPPGTTTISQYLLDYGVINGEWPARQMAQMTSRMGIKCSQVAFDRHRDKGDIVQTATVMAPNKLRDMGVHRVNAYDVHVIEEVLRKEFPDIWQEVLRAQIRMQ